MLKLTEHRETAMQTTNLTMKRIVLIVLTLATAWVVAAGVCVMGCAGKKPQTVEERASAITAELNKTLRDTVKDEGRLQQMLAIADQGAADLQEFDAKLAKLQKEQDGLLADYNASKDEFKQLGDRLQALRKETRSKVISARQALAQLATDEEWKKITSHNLEILGN